MDSSLHEVWQAASGSPFLPTIGKGSQFFVGFVLLVIGIALSGLFALSWSSCSKLALSNSNIASSDRSVTNVPILGIPASLAVAYVAFWTLIKRNWY